MLLTIRPELPADIPDIDTLTEAAFRTAPHTSHTEQFIVNALRQAGALHLSLVAQDDAGALVGHVGVSPVTVSDGSPRWYGLAPLSVTTERQRQGIGALREAFADAPQDRIELPTLDVRDEAQAQAAADAAMRRFGVGTGCLRPVRRRAHSG